MAIYYLNHINAFRSMRIALKVALPVLFIYLSDVKGFTLKHPIDTIQTGRNDFFVLQKYFRSEGSSQWSNFQLIITRILPVYRRPAKLKNMTNPRTANDEVTIKKGTVSTVSSFQNRANVTLQNNDKLPNIISNGTNIEAKEWSVCKFQISKVW